MSTKIIIAIIVVLLLIVLFFASRSGKSSSIQKNELKTKKQPETDTVPAPSEALDQKSDLAPTALEDKKAIEATVPQDIPNKTSIAEPTVQEDSSSQRASFLKETEDSKSSNIVVDKTETSKPETSKPKVDSTLAKDNTITSLSPNSTSTSAPTDSKVSKKSATDSTPSTPVAKKELSETAPVKSELEEADVTKSDLPNKTTAPDLAEDITDTYLSESVQVVDDSSDADTKSDAEDLYIEEVESELSKKNKDIADIETGKTVEGRLESATPNTDDSKQVDVKPIASDLAQSDTEAEDLVKKETLKKENVETKTADKETVEAKKEATKEIDKEATKEVEKVDSKPEAPELTDTVSSDTVSNKADTDKVKPIEADTEKATTRTETTGTDKVSDDSRKAESAKSELNTIKLEDGEISSDETKTSKPVNDKDLTPPRSEPSTPKLFDRAFPILDTEETSRAKGRTDNTARSNNTTKKEDYLLADTKPITNNPTIIESQSVKSQSVDSEPLNSKPLDSKPQGSKHIDSANVDKMSVVKNDSMQGKLPAYSINQKVSETQPATGLKDDKLVEDTLPAFDFVKDIDNVQLTLDLAQQYLEVGEYESAKRLVKEVIDGDGTEEQITTAQDILNRLY